MTKALCNNLKKQLALKNLSVNSFERQCNLKPCSIHNILNGRSKKPSFELIQIIAKELDCSIDDLTKEKTKVSDSKACTPWNSPLYTQCLELTEKIFQKKNILPTKEQLIAAVDEIYKYSLKTSNQVDEKFAEWLVERFYA